MDTGAVGEVGEQHRKRLRERFGARVDHWLAVLPRRTDDMAARWGLRYTGVRHAGRTSVVYGCDYGGAPAMLKLCPDPGLIVAEAGTLRLWQETSRVPQVWQVDTTEGALLMEEIRPGDAIGRRGEVPDMRDVAALLTELHAVRISEEQRAELRPMSGWVHFFFEHWRHRREEGPAAEVVPPSTLHRGYCRARALAEESRYSVLLHGDLHRGNVLDGGPERGLVAIDPKGCVGDAVFDAVDWAIWAAESEAEVERRVAVLARELRVEPDHLHRACGMLAPVAAVAGIDNGTASDAQVATLLALAERV